MWSYSGEFIVVQFCFWCLPRRRYDSAQEGQADYLSRVGLPMSLWAALCGRGNGSRVVDGGKVSRGQHFHMLFHLTFMVTLVVRGVSPHLYMSGNRLRELHPRLRRKCWSWDFNPGLSDFKVSCLSLLHGLWKRGHGMGQAFFPCHQAHRRLLRGP